MALLTAALVARLVLPCGGAPRSAQVHVELAEAAHQLRALHFADAAERFATICAEAAPEAGSAPSRGAHELVAEAADGLLRCGDAPSALQCLGRLGVAPETGLGTLVLARASVSRDLSRLSGAERSALAELVGSAALADPPDTEFAMWAADTLRHRLMAPSRGATVWAEAVSRLPAQAALQPPQLDRCEWAAGELQATNNAAATALKERLAAAGDLSSVWQGDWRSALRLPPSLSPPAASGSARVLAESPKMWLVEEFATAKECADIISAG
jgi:hypothetical protein